MDIADRLDRIASLIEKGARARTKTASASSAQPIDIDTIRAGIYLKAKEASYLDVFIDAAERGVL